MTSHPPPQPPIAAIGRDAGPAAATPPSVDSAALLEGGRELIIQHGTERYRLRLTALNKLILTK